MLKRFFIYTFDFEPKVKNIMNAGFKVCFILTLFSTFMMSLYITSIPNYILYDLGIVLFKTATTFMSMFLICGIAFSKIIKNTK